MANQKTIKFIKAWQLHVIGATITVNAPIADLLIQRGRAEEVVQPASKKPKLQMKQVTP